MNRLIILGITGGLAFFGIAGDADAVVCSPPHAEG
jgi:hypothetical protein